MARAPRDDGDGKETRICVVQLHPPGPNMGRQITLTSSRYTVGRDAANDITVQRDSVSRTHAALAVDDEGQWHVCDLNSTNGTFVNEAQVQDAVLCHGDRIRFGEVIFKFLSGGNVEAAYHEEIYRLTILDGLTGLHNRRYLLEFLERELSSAHRHNNPLSLVLFDIDHFKHINDEFGHLCGDAALKQLGDRLGSRARREDLFARYGGEEFAAVLNLTALSGALAFAESVRTLVASTPFEFDDKSFSMTVSVGVTTVHNEPAVDCAELIRRADAQMYLAKDAGRNCVRPEPGAPASVT